MRPQNRCLIYWNRIEGQSTILLFHITQNERICLNSFSNNSHYCRHSRQFLSWFSHRDSYKISPASRGEYSIVTEKMHLISKLQEHQATHCTYRKNTCCKQKWLDFFSISCTNVARHHLIVFSIAELNKKKFHSQFHVLQIRMHFNVLRILSSILKTMEWKQRVVCIEYGLLGMKLNKHDETNMYSTI